MSSPLEYKKGAGEAKGGSKSKKLDKKADGVFHELMLECKVLCSLRKTMAVQITADGSVIFWILYSATDAQVDEFARAYRDWIGK